MAETDFLRNLTAGVFHIKSLRKEIEEKAQQKLQMDTSSKGPRVRKEEKAQETYTWGHPRRGDLEWRRKNQKVQKALPRDDDLEYRRMFL